MYKFSIQMTPFSLILNLLTHYFHKILDPIGSKFVKRAEPGYRIFDEVWGCSDVAFCWRGAPRFCQILIIQKSKWNSIIRTHIELFILKKYVWGGWFDQSLASFTLIAIWFLLPWHCSQSLGLIYCNNYLVHFIHTPLLYK